MPGGRPKKPGGRAKWIPGELQRLVDALIKGDRTVALEEFSKWMSQGLDNGNKPNVN